MWEMFEDNIECDECGGSGPPKFMIPPPPRPPSVLDYGLVSNNCNDGKSVVIATLQNWENDRCETIPILDASLYNSQLLQTSAIIAVFSLLLVLVVLISTLFLWKNKRKVRNLSPCKTPTRDTHMNGLPSGHLVTYEYPDVHLGHRPLVLRRHHNVEMLHHSKGIHYPSGYPMTSSPPYLVSSSPGPDPYRSNDNVYEELDPGRESDAESEPPPHSDDDFAEDELSLPGERSFNKSTSDTASTIAVSTVDHERTNSSQCNSGQDRNSLLSSSSSSNTHNDTSTVTSETNSTSISSNNIYGLTSRTSSILSGVLRHTAEQQNNSRKNRYKPPVCSSSMDEFTTSDQLVGDMIVPMTRNYLYDSRTHNLMSLRYNDNNNFGHHSLNNNINNDNTNNRVQYYNENRVERRDRINNHIHHLPSAVSTIFQERNNINHPHRFPQPYYATSNLLNSMRCRMNTRSIDRRRIVPPMDPIEPTYGYAEPIIPEGYLYDTCARQQQYQKSSAVGQNATTIGSSKPLSYPKYISSDYCSSGLMNSLRATHHYHHPHYHNNHQLFSRENGGEGNLSFGSDSGYSHHTSTLSSSISRVENLNNDSSSSRQNKLTPVLNVDLNHRQKKTTATANNSKISSVSVDITVNSNRQGY